MSAEFYEDDEFSSESIDWYSLPTQVLLRYYERMQLQQQLRQQPQQSNRYQQLEKREQRQLQSQSQDDMIDSSSSIPTASIAQLAQLCQQHYEKMQVNEKDILPWFLYSVKNKNKLLKLKPDLNSSISNASKSSAMGS